MKAIYDSEYKADQLDDQTRHQSSAVLLGVQRLTCEHCVQCSSCTGTGTGYFYIWRAAVTRQLHS